MDGPRDVAGSEVGAEVSLLDVFEGNVGTSGGVGSGVDDGRALQSTTRTRGILEHAAWAEEWVRMSSGGAEGSAGEEEHAAARNLARVVDEGERMMVERGMSVYVNALWRGWPVRAGVDDGCGSSQERI